MHFIGEITLGVLIRIYVVRCIAFPIKDNDNIAVSLYGVALTGTQKLNKRKPSEEGVPAYVP